MHYYDIYISPGAEKAIVVKHGFSYPAFFFTWVWAIRKKLYLVAVITLVIGLLTPISIVFVVLSFLPRLLFCPARIYGSQTSMYFITNAMPYVFMWTVQACYGFFGNKLYGRMLEKKKFVLCGYYQKKSFLGTCQAWGGGIILSIAMLWLSIHNLFPIR